MNGETTTHIQNRPDDWTTATDEEHIAGLLEPKRFVDPFWMAYLKTSRPHCLTTYLNIHEARGGVVGSPADEFRKQMRG